MKEETSSVTHRLRMVRKRVEEALKRSGRLSKDVCLIGASKRVPVDLLKEAQTQGLCFFGENRVQEALPKMETLGPGIQWHFIGHLQRNKVRFVAGRFELIHSLDGFPLAKEIDRWCEKIGKKQRVLVEVNISGEASKKGVSTHKLESLLNDVRDLQWIQIEGLMTIPPYSNDPEHSRPFFRKLQELKGRYFPSTGGFSSVLSMGMSSDFEVAIEEGANYIRVGTALFGERPPLSTKI